MRHAILLALLFTAPASLFGQTIEKDIVYGQGGGKDLMLDLCRPTGKGPFAAVVCVHGGAWQAGNRGAHHGTIRGLAQNGFVAATVQYRLAPAHRWPAQIEDVKCAVRFVRSQAKAWNLDPERIAVLGDSAGGHLSLLTGLMKEGFEGKGGHADVSSQVRAVVNYYGPTDFLSWKVPPIGETLLKLGAKKSPDQLLIDFVGTADKSAKVMKEVSPITYVSKEAPPILTFQGTVDPLVPLQQAQVLHTALDKARAVNRLEVLENAGHGWGGKERERTNRTTLEFLQKHLK